MKKMAIIRNVHIGAEDHYGAALWFDTYVSEASAALQVIPWEMAYDIVKRVDDIKHLEGKPCWVEEEGGLIRFIGLWEK